MGVTNLATTYPINLIDFNKVKTGKFTAGRIVKNLREVDKVDDLLKTYIEKVDRDQASLRVDIRESERRVEKHTLESEKRMNERLDRIEAMINAQSDKIENVKETVNQKMGENKKFMWGITITIILSIIASIGVIIATYYSTISLLQNMI